MKDLVHFSHNPWRGFADFQKDMDLLMDQVFTTPRGKKTELPNAYVQQPACDVEETESGFTLQFDMPGLNKEDVRIELNENELIVSGERKNAKKNKGLSERFFGRFERRFTLPAHINVEEIQADMENGVLHLEIPKAESAKPREIKIGERKTTAG